jgi:uncharacterized membrane protein YgaE (UPF0421/DUF939 family)
MVLPESLRKQLNWLGLPALQAAKTAVATGISWFIAADIMGNSIPVFAPLAALLTVQVTIWDSVARGLQRVLGVVVGVLVAYGFARLAGINAWSIALAIFVSLLAGRALRLGQQGSIQVPVSALLVLVLGATTGGYALDRVLDTMVGAATGILVNVVVVPPTQVKGARMEVNAFARALATLLRGVAESLALPGTDLSAHLQQARRLSDDTKAASLAVERSEAATRLNPTGRRDRPAVQILQAAVTTLTHVERAARGITRALADAPPNWRPPDELGKLLSELLGNVAGELESWGAQVTSATGQGGPPGAVGARGSGLMAGASVDDLYHRALVASRAPDVEPETAAIVSAIALDAHRISQELAAALDTSAATLPSWRALFAP